MSKYLVNLPFFTVMSGCVYCVEEEKEGKILKASVCAIQSGRSNNS